MDGREPAEGVVEADDTDVLELLEPAVRQWWIDRFGEYVPENGGYFTPPQKQAIPLVHERTNTLICAPTGSGKCVKPDTPLIIQDDGETQVIRAEELLDRRGERVATVDEDGGLFESDVEAFAFDGTDVEKRPSLIYSEPYSGDMERIHTVYGREVEVTPSHPLLVETPDGPEWKPASEVNAGDRIGVPRRVDLPEREVTLDVKDAIESLRERYPTVVTHEDSVRILGAIESAERLADVREEDLRAAFALADLTMEDVASELSVGISTVHKQVVHETEYEGQRALELLANEVELLDQDEVAVKTSNGSVSRFHYPTTIDEELAALCAFVLAEGLLAEYERSTFLMITQSRHDGLLDDALRTVQERFGVDIKRKTEKDFILGESAFAVFFATLFGIEMGRIREVRFPDWILDAEKPIKRAFLSTFLSLEAEVREDEVRVIQANEMKIEQLNYLLLSFGILPGRSTTTKYATNTEAQTERTYCCLTVRRKPNLFRLTSELEINHENAGALEQYADGETSGSRTGKWLFDYGEIRKLSRYYEDDQAFTADLGNVYEVVRRTGRITQGALETLSDVLDRLPDDETTASVRANVDELRERNVAWLEVTSSETVAYDGEVIDLTVPGPHNFVGGRGGIYLHNTLASFTSIINELFRRGRTEGLENTVYCLYVSPLKSLANDIQRNLAEPLAEITADQPVEIRQAIRHGDTDKATRGRMLEETPHVLNTTPETLAILLNSPKFREKLRSVEYVIVDEIHSLADDKRGTHLSVSLERLEDLAESSPTRIGCSATVEPLETMAEFLVGRESAGGAPRDYEIVDARFVRDFDLELVCPTDDLVGTPNYVVQDRFYERLESWIRDHDTTLVFTNTRSGAERVLYNLRERYGYDERNSGCHHGSLSKERREQVEARLKAGDLDVVTTSTSLELGIDMPTLDLVVQIGSPKSVAALLQRVGRAGHSPGDTVKGRVVALDRDELVECAVMLKKAEEGFVDRAFVPENAQDVAAQHVYGMAINAIRPEREVLATLRRAYPYRDYGDEAWESLMRYLTADYPGMEDRNVYAKVWRDENDAPGGRHHYEEFPPGERLIGKRGRLARPIYLTNVGTIPDSFTCDVLVRGSKEWVGELDEGYLDTLEPGDVFVLGGGSYEFQYRRGSKVYVDHADGRPTVPSWFSERLPLSLDLGREVLDFQEEVVRRHERGGQAAVREWLRGFPLDEDAVYALSRVYDEQIRYAGAESVSTPDRLVVEEERDQSEYRRRYYVHSNYGRRFNDGLSRLLAHRSAQAATANVAVAVADNGFVLSMPLNRKVDVQGLLTEIDPTEVRRDLRASLRETDLLERYFRINATRALMILKRYKGYEKSAGRQQVDSEMLLGFAHDLEDFAVLEETYREILEDKLAVSAIEDVIADVRAGSIDVVHHAVDSPTPRAFGLATLSTSDVVLAEDESAVLQEFHERVVRAIEGS